MNSKLHHHFRQQIGRQAKIYALEWRDPLGARLLITKGSMPKQTRSLIQYALEIKDPYLGQLVRRVEAGEVTIDHVHLE